MEQQALRKNALSTYQVGGIAFLTVVLLSLVYTGWWLDNWLEDAQKAPVKKVVVTGNRIHVSDTAIANSVKARHSESFFKIDVDSVHRQVEGMPWVYRASVRKRWPSTLNIHVVEEIATARWNGDSLLNQYGQAFNAQLDDAVLPNLFGPGGSEKTALQGYRAMQTLLNSESLTIEELYLSERFAWNLRLKNGVRLNLGRSEFVDRLQRFVDVYPLLKQQNKQIEYVDLRYDTGLAVGWKRLTEHKQES